MHGLLKRGAGVMAGAALTAGGLVLAPAAQATVTAPAVVATASASAHWVDYYPHYFYTLKKCQARGRGVLGQSGGVGGRIPGAIAYDCYRAIGDVKWSMDILLQDTAGSGGGGGGGGSWSPTR